MSGNQAQVPVQDRRRSEENLQVIIDGLREISEQLKEEARQREQQQPQILPRRKKQPKIFPAFDAYNNMELSVAMLNSTYNRRLKPQRTKDDLDILIEKQTIARIDREVQFASREMEPVIDFENDLADFVEECFPGPDEDQTPEEQDDRFKDFTIYYFIANEE